MTMLKPPPEWQAREDAFELRRAIAELAYAEAEVLRAEERLKINAPHDGHWDVIYSWAERYDDGPIELLGNLHAARDARDEAANAYASHPLAQRRRDRR